MMQMNQNLIQRMKRRMKKMRKRKKRKSPMIVLKI